MPTKPVKKRRPWEGKPKKKQEGRGADNSFYQSTPWRKLAIVHKRAHPLCAECESKGKIVPVAVTDHIKPISEGGEPLDWSNLQSLCHPCHNRKSGRERHHKREES